MEPVNSNIRSKSCPDPIGANCITVQGACGPTSLTDILTTLTRSSVDVSTLDLSCIYSPIITSYTCPSGWNFIADISVANGIGYCSNGCPPGQRPSTRIPSGGGPPEPICLNCFPASCPAPAPVIVTSANPIPRPTTATAIMQLIIDRICKCDPCTTSFPNG